MRLSSSAVGVASGVGTTIGHAITAEESDCAGRSSFTIVARGDRSGATAAAFAFVIVRTAGSGALRMPTAGAAGGAGMRMPVASILSYLSSGMTIEEILNEWPELEREDIYEALGYAAWTMEERVVPLEEATAK